jgi:hypothetical protein
MLNDVLRKTTNRGIIDALPPPPRTHSERIAARTKNMSDADVLNSDELWAMTRDLMAHRADAGTPQSFSQAFSELASRRLGRELTGEEISKALLDGAAAGLITPSKLYGAAGLGLGGALGAATLTPGRAEAAPPAKQDLGGALANLTAGQEENQRNADALRVNTEPPALPPAPPRPQPPPSQMAPMPANPAMPPPWAAQLAKNAFAPYSTSPDAYAPPPQPSMVPNEVGKLRQADPAIDPRWLGAVYDAANLAMWGAGPK